MRIKRPKKREKGGVGALRWVVSAKLKIKPMKNEIICSWMWARWRVSRAQRENWNHKRQQPVATNTWWRRYFVYENANQTFCMWRKRLWRKKLWAHISSEFSGRLFLRLFPSLSGSRTSIYYTFFWPLSLSGIPPLKHFRYWPTIWRRDEVARDTSPIDNKKNPALSLVNRNFYGKNVIIPHYLFLCLDYPNEHNEWIQLVSYWEQVALIR